MCGKDKWSKWLVLFVIFMGNVEVTLSKNTTVNRPVITGSLAVNDTIQLNEDSNLVFDALNNDKRPTGGLTFDLTRFKITMPPSNGSSTAYNTGEIAYEPAQNFYGRDSLKYEICNSAVIPFCETATVYVTVFPVNDSPILIKDTITIPEDEYAYSSPLENDQDNQDQVKGLDLSTFRILQKPDFIFSEIAGDSILLVPNSNFFGESHLTYEICDKNKPSICATATITITVENINDPPILENDAVEGQEERTITLNPLLNDYDLLDPNDKIDPGSLTIIKGPANGKIFINTDNQVVYNPNKDFFGKDQVTYQACDDGDKPMCSTADINFTITNINDAPIAISDSIWINEDESATLSLVSNDIDPEGRLDHSSLKIIKEPQAGSYVINVLTGEISYQSEQDYSGSDKIQYNICDLETPALCSSGWLLIHINAKNDIPIAIADSLITNEDEPASILPLVNDSDPGEDTGIDPSTFRILDTPKLGVLLYDTISATLSLAPHAQLNGTEVIDYEICDYDGGCTQSKIFIQVTAVNDIPTVNDDFIAGLEDNPIDISVLLNDYDSLDIDGMLDVSTIKVTRAPSNGTFQINPFDGFITYLPSSNWNGKESLTYEVCDDQGACGSAEVFITIQPVNDLPNLTNDEINLFINESACINPLSNDDDLADESILNTNSFQLLDSTTLGQLIFEPSNASLCFDAYDQTGTYVIPYQVCDIDSLPSCSTGSIKIKITVDSLGIIANDDQVQVNYNQTVEFSVHENDELFSSSAFFLTSQIEVITAPISGDLIFDQQLKTFLYQPKDPSAQQDSFTYEICNNLGQCDQAQVEILIKRQNLPPVVNDDIYFVSDVTQPIIITALENDIDPEGQLDLGSLAAVLQPQHGTITYDSATQTFTYLPGPTFVDHDSFRYQVCDIGDLTNEPKCEEGDVHIFNLTNRNFLQKDTIKVFEDVLKTIAFSDSIKTVTLEVQGENGAVTQNAASGDWEYLSSKNFYGADYLQYEVCTDSSCFVLPIILNILPVNDPPVLVSDFASTELGATITVDVLQNDQDDADAEGGIDYMSLSVLKAPTTGTAIVNSVGRIVYDAGDEITTDTIVYQVCDIGFPNPPVCERDTLFVNVKLSTTAISDDQAQLLEDEIIAIDALENDSESANKFAHFDFSSISISKSANSGSVTFDADLGEFVYQPNAHFNGQDTFTYMVCDQSSNCGSAEVTIDVLPVNDAPLAVADSIYTKLNQSIKFNVTDNDSDHLDADGKIDHQSVTIVTWPENGIITALGNGGFSFEPDPQFFGWESMTYEVCDNGTPALCATATIDVLVQPNRDLLKVGIDTFVVSEDELLKAIPFERYAGIGQYDLKSAVITKTVSNGEIDFNALNGQFSYMPATHFNGTDTFSYHICPKDTVLFDCSEGTVIISVLPVNDLPIVNNDQVNTKEEVAVNFFVLDNDTDANDPLGAIDQQTLSIISDTPNGTLTLNANQSFDYQPDTDFVGNDQFTYQVCDTGFGTGGILCQQGVVTITVQEQNDLPTANPDTVRTNEDNAINFRLDLNDYDTDSELDLAGITITSDVSNGKYYFNPINAMVSYQPNKDFFGTDRLTYKICEKGENSSCAFADAIIIVKSINDAPIARNDVYEVANNRSIEINPLLNDDDPFDPDSEIEPLTLKLLDDPQNGVFTALSDGQLKFEPNEFFIGTETVKYQICDQGDPTPVKCAQAVITIKVIEQDNLVQDDYYELTEGDVISYNVLENDAGPSDPTVSLLPNEQELITQPSNGTVEIHPLTGIHTYSSANDFYGVIVYTYQVCDNYPLGRRCYQAEVTLNIEEFNQVPLAVADDYQVDMNEQFTGNILANDSDPDGHQYQLILPLQRQPGQGSLNLLPDGSFTYTPNLEYEGTDSFDYQICDNGQIPLCNTARVTFNVAFRGMAPIANDDEITLTENTSFQGNFLGNDSDPEGYAITIPADSIQMPKNGSLELAINGSFMYIPNADYVGTDYATYWICNNNPTRNLCSQAIVTFIVIPLKEQWLPDAFTPNYDGLNDEYLPIMNHQPEGFKMAIFNRWGEMIFVSEDPNRGWSGDYLGEPASAGNYVVKIWLNKKTHSKTIQLIR